MQPKTVRQNNMITLTAARIASNTQLEVFLKVKQASNVDFSFLNPTDELYEYYLYLKGKHCNATSNINKNDSGDNKKGENNSDTSDNPLSGLLGGYASSSSDEEEGTKISEEKKDTCLNNNEDNCPTGAQKPGGTSDDEQDRKRKANRLKRLKAWKESRLKQEL